MSSGPTSRPRAPAKPDAVDRAEYIMLMLLLTGAIIGVALFVSWAAEQRGLLAPGTTPGRRPPTFDPDYVPPPDEATDGT